MRRFVEAGRQRGAPVERLIVLLKELWATLPPDPDGASRLTAHGGGSRAVLEGIIRVCIEEFYAPTPAVPGRPTSDRCSGGEATDGRTDGAATPA